MRYGPTGEAYTHRRKEGKLIVNDFTDFMPEHKKWGEARDNGRPNVLFQYECADGRKEYKRPTKFERLKDEEVQIHFKPDGFAIRNLDHIPHPVVSVIPGWEMEAMLRLNSDIGDIDFSDRMVPVRKLRSIPTGVQNERLKGKTTKKNKQFKQVNGRQADGSQPASFSRSTSATCHTVAASRA